MKEARKTHDHAARLKEQAGEITERLRNAGLTVEQGASILRLEPETLRKYSRGYQPASDRVMGLIREHIVPARRSPHATANGAEDSAQPGGAAPGDVEALVEILTREHSPARLTGLLNQVLNDCEMSAGFRSLAARILGAAMAARFRNGGKK